MEEYEFTDDEIMQALTRYVYKDYEDDGEEIKVYYDKEIENGIEVLNPKGEWLIQRINRNEINVLIKQIKLTLKKQTIIANNNVELIMKVLDEIKLEHCDEEIRETIYKIVDIYQRKMKVYINNNEMEGREKVFAMYIGLVGIYENLYETDEKKMYILKYGYTSDIRKRKNQHAKMYGQFELMYHQYFIPKIMMIDEQETNIECYKEEIEAEIRKELIKKNVMMIPFANNGRRMELFALTDLKKVDIIIETIEKIIEDCENEYMNKIRKKCIYLMNYVPTLEFKINEYEMKNSKSDYTMALSVRKKIEDIINECKENAKNIDIGLIEQLNGYIMSEIKLEKQIELIKKRNIEEYNELQKSYEAQIKNLMYHISNLRNELEEEKIQNQLLQIELDMMKESDQHNEPTLIKSDENKKPETIKNPKQSRANRSKSISSTSKPKIKKNKSKKIDNKELYLSSESD
jgi:hypothetical protein